MEDLRSTAGLLKVKPNGRGLAGSFGVSCLLAIGAARENVLDNNIGMRQALERQRKGCCFQCVLSDGTTMSYDTASRLGR